MKWILVVSTTQILCFFSLSLLVLGRKMYWLHALRPHRHYSYVMASDFADCCCCFSTRFLVNVKLPDKRWTSLFLTAYFWCSIRFVRFFFYYLACECLCACVCVFVWGRQWFEIDSSECRENCTRHHFSRLTHPLMFRYILFVLSQMSWSFLSVLGICCIAKNAVASCHLNTYFGRRLDASNS